MPKEKKKKEKAESTVVEEDRQYPDGVFPKTTRKRINLGVTMQLEEFGFVRIDASTEADIEDTDAAFLDMAKTTYKQLQTATMGLASKFKVLREQALDELYQREDK